MRALTRCRRPIPPIQKGITVTLTELVTDDKLQAIMAVREVTGLGLKQAKDLVEAVLAGTPSALMTGIAPRQAVEIEKRFETLGRILVSPA